MCHNTETADFLGEQHRGSERKQHQGPRTAAPLIIPIYGQLPKQYRRNGVRTIALSGLRKISPLHLGGAQRDISGDSPHRAYSHMTLVREMPSS